MSARKGGRDRAVGADAEPRRAGWEYGKPITIADSAVITPYIGFQHLIIYGNSAVLDATPNVNALQQCGYQGIQGNGGTTPGAPNCKNQVGGVPENGDFNNNITFNAVQVHRERGFAGVTYRYELLYLGAQFLMDMVPPSNIDPDLDSTLQWTISLQGGVFF